MTETRHLLILSVRSEYDASCSWRHPESCEQLPDESADRGASGTFWACEFGDWRKLPRLSALPVKLGVYAMEMRDGEARFEFVRDLEDGDPLG